MSQRPSRIRSQLMNQSQIRIPFAHLDPAFAKLAKEAETHHGIMSVVGQLLAGSSAALSLGAIHAASVAPSPLLVGAAAAVGVVGTGAAIMMPEHRVKALHDLMEDHLRRGEAIIPKEHRMSYTGFVNPSDAMRTHKHFKVENGHFIFTRAPQDKVAYEQQQTRFNRRIGLSGRQRIGYFGPKLNEKPREKAR